ncbi:MAG: hypothetical protein ACRC7I_01805 [Selenomonadaceae bacterium]
MSIQTTKKKAILLAMAGAFAIGGIAVPFMQNASAAAAKNEPAICQSDKGHQDKFIKQAAAELGVEQQTLKDFFALGNGPRDLHMALIFSEASGKSLRTVLADKTAAVSWPELEKKYSLDRAQLHQAREKLMIRQVVKFSGLDEQSVRDLLQAGYQPHDIAFAGKLANKTHTAVQSVLDKKKINNSWHDVAKELGLTESDLVPEKKDFPFFMMNRPQGEPHPASMESPVPDSPPAE